MSTYILILRERGEREGGKKMERDRKRERERKRERKRERGAIYKARKQL